MKASSPATFYDRLFDDPATPFLYPVEHSPYMPMYAAVLELIPWGRTVVELGCGAGQLGEMIRERSVHYVGIDFSERMIEQARRLMPNGDLRLADLRYDPIPLAEVYVATEVLEHLDDDLGLIAKLQLGAMVVISVPSFDSESHVRIFPNRGDARRRYEGMLAFDSEQYIMRPRGAFFHVLRGTRE